MLFKKKDKVSGSDDNLENGDDENPKGSGVDNINVSLYNYDEI